MEARVNLHYQSLQSAVPMCHAGGTGTGGLFIVDAPVGSGLGLQSQLYLFLFIYFE